MDKQPTRSSDQLRCPTPMVNVTSRSASFDQRTRSEGKHMLRRRQSPLLLFYQPILVYQPILGTLHVLLPAMGAYDESCDKDADCYDLDSWVEIASQPSSSSLSSAADDIVTTGLHTHRDPRRRRRRSLRSARPSNLHFTTRPQTGGTTSSQEEYEESESESDRAMTSSGEALQAASHTFNGTDISPAQQSSASDDSVPEAVDDDDGDRTAINYPIHHDQCFTPQPNAFSRPPSSQIRHASQPVPGSYFPAQASTTRHSLPAPRNANSSSHMPQNILSPSYNAAAQHEEALRSSLTTLLSCAAAARGLPKSESKRQQTTTAAAQPRSNRIEPLSLNLIPESQLPSRARGPAASSPPTFHEPTFKPTIRRDSTSTSTSSEQQRLRDTKRKAVRTSSRERRSLKKPRRSTSSEDLQVSPTLLTWVVSAGVVVFLSALSFSAGYSLGKEAGRIEAGDFLITDDAPMRAMSCAREAGRSSMGLKRSLARSAMQV